MHWLGGGLGLRLCEDITESGMGTGGERGLQGKRRIAAHFLFFVL